MEKYSFIEWLTIIRAIQHFKRKNNFGEIVLSSSIV